MRTRELWCSYRSAFGAMIDDPNETYKRTRWHYKRENQIQSKPNLRSKLRQYTKQSNSNTKSHISMHIMIVSMHIIAITIAQTKSMVWAANHMSPPMLSSGKTCGKSATRLLFTRIIWKQYAFLLARIYNFPCLHWHLTTDDRNRNCSCSCNGNCMRIISQQTINGRALLNHAQTFNFFLMQFFDITHRLRSLWCKFLNRNVAVAIAWVAVLGGRRN